MLDLFFGTGSVGKVYREAGFEVTSVDSDPKWGADFVVDILTWDYRKEFRPGDFHTVVCAPPCTEFSVALTTRPRDLGVADCLVQKALEIIDYLKPKRWWMENPRWGHLRHREYMEGRPFIDVDYCQYAEWGYQKPTRIWGSEDILGVDARVCDGHTCRNLTPGPPKKQGAKRAHRVCLSSKHQNLAPASKYRIPPALVKALMETPPATVSEPERTVRLAELEVMEGLQFNQVVERPDGERQLLLEVTAEHPSGRTVTMHVLVDTGAEANLIRKGLMPDLMVPSTRPLALYTADGSRMDGGRREVNLALVFGARKWRERKGPAWDWRATASFHEADIQVDAILSHPWLVSKRLGVFPHLKSLALLTEPLVLLRGRRAQPARGLLDDDPAQIARVAEVRAMNE